MAVKSLFQQLPPQLRHPPANRSVQNPVAHPDDRTAEDLRLHQIRGDYLLVELATEIFLDRFPQLLVRLPGQRHRGPDPVHLLIHQSQILRRHFPQKPLSPALHQRLEPEDEIPGCILECSAKEPRLLALRNTRRHEHRLDPRDRIHRGGHRVDQVGIALGLPAPARDIEQDFRVIAGDRLVTHRMPRLARYSRTSLRSVSVSSRSPINLDAAASDSSTASPRSSAIARSRSLPISRRARSSSCCCSCIVFSIASARSFSALVRASTSSPCAWVLASASSFLCSASSATDSARFRSASSSCSCRARSRASTAPRRAG